MHIVSIMQLSFAKHAHFAAFTYSILQTIPAIRFVVHPSLRIHVNHSANCGGHRQNLPAAPA